VPRVGRVAWRQPAFTLGVLGLGVGTALAIVLFVTSVLYAGAARAAALSSTSPLFGVPIAAILLKEPLTLRLVGGVGLIVAGVWFILAR
jgi:drug/metabolite transporter (DMT)-like permease